MVELCDRSSAVSRFWITEIPPRYTHSISYPWEDNRTQLGTFWPFLAQSYDKEFWASYRWEIEFFEGLSTTNSVACISQQWERAYSGAVQQHYTVALPRNHDRIKRVAYDDRRLWATSMKELDRPGNEWSQDGGRIDFYLMGAGRARSIELYQIQTAYNQEYALIDSDHGIPRQFTGARTYATEDGVMNSGYAYMSDGDVANLITVQLVRLGHRITQETTSSATKYFTTQPWEKEHLEGETDLTEGSSINSYGWEADFDSDATFYTYAIGNIRGIASPDRQYLVSQYNLMEPLGGIREFKSSVNSLLVQEVVVPAIELEEEDTPDFLPPQLFKYLRDFTLSRAFARVGEGHRGDLADHYMRRFSRGVRTFKVLQDAAHKAREWQRDRTTRARGRRPPRVRLPSNFPRVHI